MSTTSPSDGINARIPKRSAIVSASAWAGSGYPWVQETVSGFSPKSSSHAHSSSRSA
jgi:hypothetical protein